MQLDKIPKAGTTISRKRFWDKARDTVLSLQKKEGRNVSVDERKGLGTVINVVREIGGEAEPTGACCHDTECTPDQTQTQCEDSGGVWVGPDTVCDPNPCLNDCDCAIDVGISTSVTADACPGACDGWTGEISHSAFTHTFAAADFDGSCDAFLEIPRLFCESGCTDDPEGFSCAEGEVNSAQIFGALGATFDCSTREVEVLVEWDAGCACCTEPCSEENCPASFCGGSNGATFRADHILDMDDHGTHTFDDHVSSTNFGGICTADIHTEITI